MSVRHVAKSLNHQQLLVVIRVVQRFPQAAQHLVDLGQRNRRTREQRVVRMGRSMLQFASVECQSGELDLPARVWRRLRLTRWGLPEHPLSKPSPCRALQAIRLRTVGAPGSGGSIRREAQ
jgi:hypothetical protein